MYRYYVQDTYDTRIFPSNNTKQVQKIKIQHVNIKGSLNFQSSLYAQIETEFIE